MLTPPFNKPDLVVFHAVNNIENIKIYRALLSNKIPYIIVPHGELTKFALKKKWLKKKIAYSLFFNRFIRKAEGLQCLSLQEMTDTEHKQFKFIGTNGVYSNNDKKRHVDDSEDCKILYLGRLELLIKGLDRLVGAVSLIKEFCKSKKVKINIYGPDILGRREALQKLIDESGVSDIITIYDPVYGEEKKKVILDHDLFIQTSRSEGMPVGILEIMDFGLPCILTNGTRLIDDLVKYDAGYYAGESNEIIATTIEKAVNDKSNYQKLSENAVKLVKENYLWDKVSADNILKYKDIHKKWNGNNEINKTQSSSSAKKQQNLIVALLSIVWLLFVVNLMYLDDAIVNKIILVANTLLIIIISFVLFKDRRANFFAVMIINFIAILNGFLNGSGIGSVLCFNSIFTLIVISRFVIFTPAQENFLNTVFFLGFIMIFILFSKRIGIYYVLIFDNSVQLNPNGYAGVFIASAMLMYSIINKITGVFIANAMIPYSVVNKIKGIEILKKILFALLFVIFSILLMETEARTSIMAWFLFNIMCFLKSSKIFTNYQMRKKLILIMIIGCLMVTVGYVVLYIVLGENFTIFGKTFFSGRQAIWLEVFDRLKSNWFFGFSNKVVLPGGWLNTHNGFLAIFGNLGIIPFIGFIVFLSISASKFSKGNFNIDIVKFIGLLSLLVLSTFENIILDALCYYLFIPFLFNKTEVRYDT